MANKKRAPKVDALTKQEEKFCQHYAIHQHGADAIRHANPALRKKSPQYCAEQASKWLQRSKLQARLTVLMKRVAAKATEEFDITADKIIQEMAAIAFANSDDYYEWGVQYVPKYNKKTGEPLVNPETGEYITEPRPFAIIKPSNGLSKTQKKAIIGADMSFTREGMPMVSVKMADKRGALKDLFAMKGYNKPIDIELSGKGGGPVEMKDVSDVKKLDPVEAMKAFEAFRAAITG